MLATTLTLIAIVTQDQAALRAAPKDSAGRQAILWQGDSLEIRGEKGDFLQVYDHRRERAGYIKASQVKVQSLKPEAAPELLSIVRFLKETPGSEALGISYAAAYLRATPNPAQNGEVFAALGQMADRLAQRTSESKPGKAYDLSAAHLEVIAYYGITMQNIEREGQIQLCYEGEAHRRALALPATAIQKALAALSLTKHECVSPQLTPTERFQLDTWRADLLDRVDMTTLPDVLKNRLSLRKAGVWASLAYQRARRPEFSPAQVRETAQRAINELAAINKNELMESDAALYSDAAIRVGASRWAADAGLPLNPARPDKLSLLLTPGQPGETCLALVDAKHDAKNPLISRCTYSLVWPTSTSIHPAGDMLTVAVQPLDTWREMWVFQKKDGEWKINVLPPALETPQLGYVEFAGWVPGSPLMLAARETKSEGLYKTRFETIKLNTLETEKQADKPANLSLFYRWQDPLWKGKTVAIR